MTNTLSQIVGKSFFASREVLWNSVKLVAAATVLTGIIGLLLKFIIEKFMLRDVPHAEIELLFGNLALISTSLAAVGVLIIFAGWKLRRSPGQNAALGLKDAFSIGAVQGICLPFRGFSRSGATISAGLLLGITKIRAEEFSIALAVVLTPLVIAREVLRLLKTHQSSSLNMTSMAGPIFSKPAGYGIELCLRHVVTAVAFRLAGARPLASVRHLLSVCIGHGSSS